MNDHPKKLIEVALPLDEINEACKADKGRAHGTIKNLHKWFAPMPLPAWRALLYAALIDDPGDDEKRAYHLDVIKRMMRNGADLPDTETLSEARANLVQQFPNGLPPLLDPFCGGGSTLVEGQRLGLETFGSDLNPVPILITRTLTDVLPRVYGKPPLHANQPYVGALSGKTSRRAAQETLLEVAVPSVRHSGFEGLLSDFNFYSHLVLEVVAEQVEDLYPRQQAEVPIAWVWARSMTCPNPACGIETVLTTTWWLSKVPGELAWIEPRVENGRLALTVISNAREGVAPESPKSGRGASFVCAACSQLITDDVVREVGQSVGLGLRLLAVIVQRDGVRVYRAPVEDEEAAALEIPVPEDLPEISLGPPNQYVSPPRYGLRSQLDLYTSRQLRVLSEFADAIAGVHDRVLEDGGSEEWATAITTLLGLVLGRMSQGSSSQARLAIRPHVTSFETAFPRNDLPISWDFYECYLLGDSGPSWLNSCASSMRALKNLTGFASGHARLSDARLASMPTRGIVATDPPYFDAIGYADLSDYFYLWHRRALRNVHPDLYRTVATPKDGELTAFPWQHGGTKSGAREYFIEGFTQVFEHLQGSLAADLPMLVVYASKEQKGGVEEETRWSSILTAMVQANLEITGTWPIHGTSGRRMLGQGQNTVASYVVMAARPRPEGASTISLQDFNRTLRRELKPAIQNLQAAGILPVDLAQAAMGPGMQVYSRYRAILDQSGQVVSVEAALRLINQARSEVLDEQEGDLDADSRFAVTWWEKHHWEPAAFGEADQLARPHGLSVDDLVRAGVVVYPKPGQVQVVGSAGLERSWQPSSDSRPTAWEAVHHLADRLIDGGGVGEAGELMSHLGGLRDQAQALVYRLDSIAARRGWTGDQERYNALIGSWSDLLAEAGRSHALGDGLF